MEQLTKNFNLSEFKCKCGCEMTRPIIIELTDLAYNLQKLRDAVNKPIKVTSGYRCPHYNLQIKGAKESKHMLGKAADIQIDGMSPKEVKKEIEKLIKAKQMREGGIGVYSTFTHYDGRGSKVRW